MNTQNILKSGVARGARAADGLRRDIRQKSSRGIVRDFVSPCRMSFLSLLVA
jgi:hypothetical protein